MARMPVCAEAGWHGLMPIARSMTNWGQEMLALTHKATHSDMEIASPKSVLDIVDRRAQAKWGKRGWKQRLAEEYCRLSELSDGKKVAVPSRRKHLDQVFERGNCNLETVLILLACVDCKMQIACTTVEVEELIG